MADNLTLSQCHVSKNLYYGYKKKDKLLKIIIFTKAGNEHKEMAILKIKDHPILEQCTIKIISLCPDLPGIFICNEKKITLKDIYEGRDCSFRNNGISIDGKVQIIEIHNYKEKNVCVQFMIWGHASYGAYIYPEFNYFSNPRKFNREVIISKVLEKFGETNYVNKIRALLLQDVLDFLRAQDEDFGENKEKQLLENLRIN